MGYGAAGLSVLLILFVLVFGRSVENQCEARLDACGPHRKISGSAKRTVYKDNGEIRFRVWIRSLPFPDHSSMGIFLDGRNVANTTVEKGLGILRLSSLRGEPIPDVSEKTRIEVRFGTETIAEGRFGTHQIG